MEQGSQEKPYELAVDPEWAKTVDGWEWDPRDDGSYAKHGACPRCGHNIGFVETPLIYAAFETAQAASVEGRRFHACNCGVAHPGAPEGVTGCGAGGAILPADGEDGHE